jgi:eukaryotic-like serine/threonine-protein kinase
MAAIHAEDSARLLQAAHDAEPRNERILTWLVRARQLQAQLALARGDRALAEAHLAGTIALIEPAWQASLGEMLRIWRARTDLLQGEIAARGDDPARAVAAWQSASQLLGEAEGEVPFARLDPLVRALLYLGDEARAQPHMRRLAAAGYEPLQPFPVGGSVDAAMTSRMD